MYRPTYEFYDDRRDDHGLDTPLQWSDRNGININYIDSRRPNTPRLSTPRFPRPDDHLCPPPHNRRIDDVYRHVPIPRDQPRPSPPRLGPRDFSRPLPRYVPDTYSPSYRRRSPSIDHRQNITVLLPGGERTTIDLEMLNYYLPNARHFVVNLVLDVPAYLDDQHRRGAEAQAPVLEDQLRVVARHIFLFFNESVASEYAQAFNEWRNDLYAGRVDMHRAVLRAYAMCCLFDQRRSLGCSEELGSELMRFVYLAVQALMRFDDWNLVGFLFGGAARVMTEEGSRWQEEILREIWRLIEQGNGRAAEGLEMTYQMMAARGGPEGVRARRVLSIIQ